MLPLHFPVMSDEQQVVSGLDPFSIVSGDDLRCLPLAQLLYPWQESTQHVGTSVPTTPLFFLPLAHDTSPTPLVFPVHRPVMSTAQQAAVDLVVDLIARVPLKYLPAPHRASVMSSVEALLPQHIVDGSIQQESVELPVVKTPRFTLAPVHVTSVLETLLPVHLPVMSSQHALVSVPAVPEPLFVAPAPQATSSAEFVLPAHFPVMAAVGAGVIVVLKHAGGAGGAGAGH